MTESAKILGAIGLDLEREVRVARRGSVHPVKQAEKLYTLTNS